jgi:SAM-dependent methyltransferase
MKQRRPRRGPAWQHGAIDDKQLRAQAYGESYQATYGFEAVMVRVRQDSILGLLPDCADLVVVEAGCGTDLLVERAMPAHRVRQWVIVEPSAAFAAAARERCVHDSRVHVVEAFFEDAAPDIMAAAGRSPDVIICSSLLHEVPDPHGLLMAAADLLDRAGRLIVNVPNAGSMHRRLAVTMGLLADTRELSPRNVELDQPRVLDAADLDDLLTAAGFEVVDRGGYFVKPFTHVQMAEIPFLDDAVIAGLNRLGSDFPDLASEIYAVARRDRGD